MKNKLSTLFVLMLAMSAYAAHAFHDNDDDDAPPRSIRQIAGSNVAEAVSTTFYAGTLALTKVEIPNYLVSAAKKYNFVKRKVGNKLSEKLGEKVGSVVHKIGEAAASTKFCCSTQIRRSALRPLVPNGIFAAETIARLTYASWGLRGDERARAQDLVIANQAVNYGLAATLAATISVPTPTGFFKSNRFLRTSTARDGVNNLSLIPQIQAGLVAADTVILIFLGFSPMDATKHVLAYGLDMIRGVAEPL